MLLHYSSTAVLRAVAVTSAGIMYYITAVDLPLITYWQCRGRWYSRTASVLSSQVNTLNKLPVYLGA